MALHVTTGQTDADLVRRALSGESQAFGQLVEKYQGLIYGLAYNRVGNTTDAQDIAQEVFVRAFRKLKQLEDPECFGAWIKTITANECRTWLRNLRPTVSLDEAEYCPAHDAASHAAWRYDEFRSEVAQAVQALPEKNRQIITLYYLSGMTCEEIAEALDMTAPAVQSRLHRARQLLRAEFTGEVEQVLGEHRLPSEFSRDVLRRATVHPVDPAGVTTAWIRGLEAGCVVMGVPQDEDGAMKLISVSMRWQEATAIGNPPPGEPLSDSHPERARARLQEYRSKGMEPIEFILYLDGFDNCRGQGVFRKGRAKIREEMKASLAIALALHAPAPILVEDRIAELREVGEDGYRFELKCDQDTLMHNIRVNLPLSRLNDMMFRMGLEVEDGINTALISRDDEQRVLHVAIEGLEGATFVHELGDDSMFVDFLWGRARSGEPTYDRQRDYRQYVLHWEPHGDGLRVTVVLTDRFPWECDRAQDA